MHIKNILIVDDDPVDSEFLTMVVKDIDPGIEVREAYSKEALFENLSQRLPDIIFIDSFINKDSGHAGIKEIKANPAYDHIPVVMYTGSADNNSIRNAFEAGAASYIVKPSTLSGIETVMQHILSKDWVIGTAVKKQYYSGQFYDFEAQEYKNNHTGT